MNDDLHEIFKLAAKYHFKKYRDKGGNQKGLAKKLGVTQSYVSSVLSGTKTASLELQSQIVNILYGGPYEEFLVIGRRIKSGLAPELHVKKEAAGSVESLIAQLTHYVMDHKRIEEELVDTKKFYEEIVENLQSGVIVSDTNDDITYLNSYMEDLIGVVAEKIIGTNQLAKDERFPKRKLDALVEYYTEAKENLEPVFYENILVTTSGDNDLWISGWIIPLKRKNRYDGMIVTIRNMTKNHKMAHGLLATLENIPAGVAIVLQEKEGAEPFNFYINRVGRKMTGVTQTYGFTFGELKRAIDTFCQIIAEDAAEKFASSCYDSFAGHKEEIVMEFDLKGGRRYHWVNQALRDEKGKYLGRMGKLTEIE